MPGAEVVISRWHATEGVCVGFLQSLLYKSYEGRERERESETDITNIPKAAMKPSPKTLKETWAALLIFCG